MLGFLNPMESSAAPGSDRIYLLVLVLSHKLVFTACCEFSYALSSLQYMGVFCHVLWTKESKLRKDIEGLCMCTLAGFPKHELWFPMLEGWGGMLSPAHGKDWTVDWKLLKRSSVEGGNLHKCSDLKQEFSLHP